MKFYKLSTSAVLASAICLISVFGLAGNAQAWSWYGFSSLCVENQYKGKNGEVIIFELEDAVVNTQCYNINTDNFDQPGSGNAGADLDPLAVESALTKIKGVVSINGCIDLRVYDHHDGGFCAVGADGVQGDGTDSAQTVPDDTGSCSSDDIPVFEHFHTCNPYNNINKEELPNTAWIGSFKANWVMWIRILMFTNRAHLEVPKK